MVLLCNGCVFYGFIAELQVVFILHTLTNEYLIAVSMNNVGTYQT